MNVNMTSNFRVPKKSNQPVLELVTRCADQKVYFQKKLFESFKKPEISKKNMKFTDYWCIKNPKSEDLYAKKRQALKLKNENVTEFYGYIYLQTESDLKKAAELGCIRIGNVPDSKLGVGSMGVSLSQYSDIYHHGKHNSMPSNGILLIIKYVKGKICYVPYDENPMEPQPEYDCHIVRNLINLETNAPSDKAFNFTQVLLYEYNDDVEIVKYPTQLLLVGAVRFECYERYIFRSISNTQNNISKLPTKRKLPESFTSNDPVARKSKCTLSVSKLTKPNDNNDFVPVMSGELVLAAETSSVININVMLMTKFREPLPLQNLICTGWELSEIIPNNNFLEYFRLNTDKVTTDTLQIPRDELVELPSSIYDGKIVPDSEKLKHAMYLNMIPSSFGNKRLLDKVITNLTKLEKVGRIAVPFFPNVQFYVFPTGKISDKLGIPKDDYTSLHVVLFFYKNPEIGRISGSDRDETIFKAQKTLYQSQLKRPQSQGIISHHSLLETVFKQNDLIKHYHKKLVSENECQDMDIDSDNENDKESKPENIRTPHLNKDMERPRLGPRTPQVNEVPLRMPTNVTNYQFAANGLILAKTVGSASNTPLQEPLVSPKIATTVSPSLSKVIDAPTPDNTQSLPLFKSPCEVLPKTNTNQRSIRPGEPHGVFRLISVTKTILPRWRAVGRKIRIRSLELLQDHPFASIYKG